MIYDGIRFLSSNRHAFGLALALFFCSAAAHGHPHIFVKTLIAIATNADGQLTGIEITWEYDEFYSLQEMELRGLDQDYDGKLTAEELPLIQSFDLQWDPGFHGDVFLFHGGEPVMLGRPEARGTEVSDGRIRSKHFRAVETPLTGQFLLRAYDPGFYTEYTLAAGGVSTGSGCEAEIEPADRIAAYNRLEEILFALPEAQTEEEFPKVGAEFADDVLIQCGD